MRKNRLNRWKNEKEIAQIKKKSSPHIFTGADNANHTKVKERHFKRINNVYCKACYCTPRSGNVNIALKSCQSLMKRQYMGSYVYT